MYFFLKLSCFSSSSSLLLFTLVSYLIIHSKVQAVETKLELRLLSGISGKMAAKTDWKPFCITVLTDLIVEPNFMQENKVPSMILKLNEATQVIKKAQISCPNLVIATKTIDSLMDWMKVKKESVTNRYGRRIAVLLMDEESVPNTINLLKSPALQIFNNLVVMNKYLGVYIRDPNDENQVLFIDKWRNNFSEAVDFYPPRLVDLNGKVLTATSFDFPPYNYRVFSEDGNDMIGMNGAEYKIAEMISENMNFKIQVVPPTDGGLWGLQGPDGNFSGLMGDVQNARTDIAWAGLFYLEERLPYYDIVYPYLFDNVCFMIKKPPPLEKWKALFQPFGAVTWIFYMVTVIICCLLAVLHAIVVFNHDFKAKGDMLQFTYQLLLDNSSPRMGDVFTHNLRVYFAILLLSSFVLTASYKGSLVSNLSVETPLKPPDTARELADQDRRVGGADSQSCDLLAVNPDNDFKDLSDNCINYGYGGLGFDLLSQGTVVMLESKTFLTYEMRNRFTNEVGEVSVYIMKQCHRVFVVGFVLPRGSIYRQRFGIKILQLASGGLIDKSFQNVYDGVALLASERGVQVSEPVRLTLYHMQGGFMVWALFMPLACFAFFFELCIPKMKKSKEP